MIPIPGGGEEPEFGEDVVAVEGALDEPEGAAEPLLLELDLAHEVVHHEGLVEVPQGEELPVQHHRGGAVPLLICRVAILKTCTKMSTNLFYLAYPHHSLYTRRESQCPSPPPLSFSLGRRRAWGWDRVVATSEGSRAPPIPAKSDQI